ncbi:MAG: hypothetical protein FWG02_10950, partial [Holophagaceae bacterium]|nr:hypothetical protein [Holophagaceae bacterium]
MKMGQMLVEVDSTIKFKLRINLYFHGKKPCHNKRTYHYYVPAYYGISLLPIIPPAGSLAVATSQGIAHMDLKGITN